MNALVRPSKCLANLRRQIIYEAGQVEHRIKITEFARWTIFEIDYIA